MTVTLPTSGTTAHRWRRVFARATAALAVASAALSASPAFAAAPPSAVPSVVSAAVASADPIGLVLSPVGQGVVRPGGALTVSITVDNGSLRPLYAADVTLALGSPLADRMALAAWLDGGDASGLHDVATSAVEPVPASDETTFGIMLEADDPALAGLVPGVYPLRATYAGPDGPVTGSSAMIVPDPDQAAATVGVVVPITAPATAEGLLTADELTELTGPTGPLTAQLDGVTGADVILAVDPAIPAAIRVLGTSAPASATAWLERLLALPHTRFALQFGDADVAAQLQSGLTRPMGPHSLRYAMLPADFVPTARPGSETATPSPTPSQTGSPTDPVYPDLEELLDIGAARPGVFWPLPGSAGPADVNTLGGLGVEATESLTLLPSTSTAQGVDGRTVPARGVAAEGAGVLVYDAGVSAALLEASQLEENSRRGAPLTEATALLAFATRDAGGAPLLVTLDRAADRSNIGIDTAVLAVANAPAVELAPLPTLAGTAPAGVTIAEAPPQAEREAATTRLRGDEDALTAFATILDDPNLLTGPERSSMLQLLGAAWTREPDAWTEALDTHLTQTQTTLRSVEILPQTTIQQLSPETLMPVWIRNDLPYPVNVVLTAKPDDLRLEVQEESSVTAAPLANTRVQVPVKAAIGSGEVIIELQLLSPTLVAIGGPQFADVTVRADWEAIGLIALSILVAAFFALGVVRTVLRRRAAKRGGGESDGDADAAADSSADE